MLAFVVGLKAEARLLRPLSRRVFVGGGTARGAANASQRALAAGATSLVSFGLAGGLAPHLAPGALVVPANVMLAGRQYPTDTALSEALGGVAGGTLLAAEAVIASVAGKAERWTGTGAEAVDMESGAVAKAAREAGVPFAVLRAVCDPADRALPPAAVSALNRSGGIGLLRLATSLLLRPGQIGDLLALSGDAKLARRALQQRVRELRESGRLEPWNRQEAARSF